ncbi:MAG: hypothetical protein ACOZCO_11670 [Bacteroidota bacterium]
MKGLSVISLLTALAAIILCFYQGSKLGELRSQAEKGKKESKPVAHTAEEHEEKLELVHYMARMQVFHAKLWFAGINDNTELAKFYIHELEEEMEAIADAGVMDEGVNISKNMEIFGLTNLQILEEQMEKKSDFKAAFEVFTSSSCNGCHISSKHPYIVIKTPESNPFFNQEFSVK